MTFEGKANLRNPFGYLESERIAAMDYLSIGIVAACFGATIALVALIEHVV